jgi:hypothetical protein
MEIVFFKKGNRYSIYCWQIKRKLETYFSAYQHRTGLLY